MVSLPRIVANLVRTLAIFAYTGARFARTVAGHALTAPEFTNSGEAARMNRQKF